MSVFLSPNVNVVHLYLKACTSGPTDLVFVLDESTSIGDANFSLVLKFVRNVIEDLTIGPTGFQIGCLTFSSNVIEQFKLNKYQSKTDLMEAIRTIRYTQLTSFMEIYSIFFDSFLFFQNETIYICLIWNPENKKE